MADDMQAGDNPLLAPWTGPFALPPFDRIAAAHFLPAFQAAFAAHRAEIARIAADPSPPDFANTLDALEGAGRLLDRVGATFWHLASAHTSPDLQAVEREVAPLSARHWAAVQMDAGLFARIDRLRTAVSAGMTASDEQRRALDLLHRRLVRGGARLDDAGKARLAEILERLAELGTRFGQNLLADEAGWTLALETPEMRAGLPGWMLDAAERCGAERGNPGVPTITLARAMVEPFLQFSAVPALRAQAYEAWIRRGETGGDSDNRALVAEILALRAERARLLGYDSFAALRLDGTMAGTPEAVHDLLGRVWPLARARAQAEHAELVALARAEDPQADVGAADWRFWSARLARTAHDLDPSQIKPYLQLDNVIAAAFDVATRLFGLRFAEVDGLALHHPDARAWDVRGPDGRHLALFIGDYFARPSKRSGAWMTGLRGQRRLGGDTRPIILNVLNLAKGAAGAPALLSLDDARTVFHEFGHALHGMMSDVVYPSIAGTAVPRDFVEFPSQLYEHWLTRPEVLGRFARHVDTDAPMPADLVARLNATRGFGQGFATVEFVASALVDMEFHARGEAAVADPMALEAEVLARIGMPAAIAMRHRTPHFAHVFAGEGYAAGYYSYLWSEVLDADGFAAFEEAGDVFDPALAARLRDHVYAAGNRCDPAEAYRAFRGRDPEAGALLAKRGLAPAAVNAARS